MSTTPRRAVVIDPSFSQPNGHHYAHHLAVAQAFAARGLETRILAHRSATSGRTGAVEIVPTFRATAYARRKDDKVINAYAGFREFNRLIEAELRSLPADAFSRGDVVLVPTVTETQLMGLVGWAAALDPERRPTVVVYLVLPCGVEADERDYEVTDPLRALFYRLALDRAAATPVRFFTAGRQLALDYAALAQRSFDSCPLPITLDPAAASRTPESRTLLLFTGEARPAKNIAALPEVARGLLRRLPDWRLLVHAHAARPWHDADAVEELARLAGEEPRLELQTGFLSPSEYAVLFGRASAVSILYEPKAYRRTSSAVLWEAISAGRPVLVADDTSLAAEAAWWGASFAAIDAGSAGAMVDGVAGVLASGGLDTALAQAGSARFRSINGVAAVAEHVLAVARENPA